MVDKMCAHYGLELVETGVGFKYICAEMLKGNVLLGFEESGGIGFPDLMPERDGIASGMMLLELLATERVSVNELLKRLAKQFGPHHYARLDTHFPVGKTGGPDGILQEPIRRRNSPARPSPLSSPAMASSSSRKTAPGSCCAVPAPNRSCAFMPRPNRMPMPKNSSPTGSGSLNGFSHGDGRILRLTHLLETPELAELGPGPRLGDSRSRLGTRT